MPCRVAPGLYIGGAGAARNLKALRKRGITHVVNAAPAVPCHFKDNPEGAFAYLQLPLFDDPDADLAPHIVASNAFIAAAHASGSGVLVHCYAGQSRSAALVIAHLMASCGLSLADAWAATRAARPCARPNAGFLRQLALYGKGLACGTPAGTPLAGAPLAGPAAALDEAAVDLDALVLTQ
ncbi:dual specificity phosphatase 1-like isoform B [Micractinium conductrix]|nr:dual specificity phosphatase 1-like isoform B [Micractinium conductrix]|eukprot:PSC76494.1 dual specificity phosphatase 1-like isoform B [Micractinium conductrix]